MRIIVVVALVTALSGCATGNPVRIEGVRITSPESVIACSYIDTVYGTSSWYGVFAEKGIENARLSAFDKAQKLGGTNLVWEPTSQGYGSSQVSGRVYRCPS